MVWQRNGSSCRLGFICAECTGSGQVGGGSKFAYSEVCDVCDGTGWFGIDATQATTARRGSSAKLAVMQVRYAAGVPLFNRGDEYGFVSVVTERYT